MGRKLSVIYFEELSIDCNALQDVHDLTTGRRHSTNHINVQLQEQIE
jgi:hypothetical protein